MVMEGYKWWKSVVTNGEIYMKVERNGLWRKKWPMEEEVESGEGGEQLTI